MFAALFFVLFCLTNLLLHDCIYIFRHGPFQKWHYIFANTCILEDVSILAFPKLKFG